MMGAPGKEHLISGNPNQASPSLLSRSQRTVVGLLPAMAARRASHALVVRLRPPNLTNRFHWKIRQYPEVTPRLVLAQENKGIIEVQGFVGQLYVLICFVVSLLAAYKNLI